MYSFGSGVLYGVRTDVANATPVNFGLVQDVSIEQSATQKDLYGQYQYPVASARGQIKTTGKATVAKISGLAFASLFFGLVPTAGAQLATQFQESQTVAATVTVANSATFVTDFGVVYLTSCLPLTKVASSPAAGQY